MPDVEETLEISIPADEGVQHEGLPSESNPQLESNDTQPQNNDLSTSNSQILCGLDGCNQGFNDLATLKEHMKAEHKKRGAGRPCDYCENKEKYQTLADDYVDKAERKTGEKVAIPFVEELALTLHKDEDTMNNWATRKVGDTEELEHPEFALTIRRLKTIQKLRLLQRTLGRFNPTGAIFQLKVNHGLIETEKKVLAGDAAEPLMVEIISEDRKNLENE